MSTRCQIGFYENTTDKLNTPHALLYRHCDGYPKGVKGDLTEFVKFFIKGRGWDIEYLPARLLCYLIFKHTQDLPGQKRIDWDGREKSDKYGGIHSYGICSPNGFHGDIEYYYAVFENRIEIYDTPFDAQPEDYKKIETIEF
jgi:hypothetical protein